jgi:hypothetical protein
MAFTKKEKRVLPDKAGIRRIFLAACLFFSLMPVSCNSLKMNQEVKHPPPAQSSDARKDSDLASTRSNLSGKEYGEGQILIKFKDGTDVASIDRIQRAFHLEPAKVVAEPHLYLMWILDGTPVEQLSRALNKVDDVEYAEPNTIYSLD